ncbi:MAG: hypothetical protein PHT02_00980 [Tissierellia bacterium]|nr:hypothetical protein [Tissierellia bacterium]
MSGRSGYVTGSYAKDKILDYIEYNKKYFDSNKNFFHMKNNNGYSSYYNFYIDKETNLFVTIDNNWNNYKKLSKEEFKECLDDIINNKKIYYLSLDDNQIEIELYISEKIIIITNDEEWKRYS